MTPGEKASLGSAGTAAEQIAALCELIGDALFQRPETASASLAIGGIGGMAEDLASQIYAIAGLTD